MINYFFNGETKLKLSHLTSVKQKIHEGVAEYIRRFRDIRNRCYSLTIYDRDLTDLAFAGLLNFHKEKLDDKHSARQKRSSLFPACRKSMKSFIASSPQPCRTLAAMMAFQEITLLFLILQNISELDSKSPQVAYIVINEFVMYSFDNNPVCVMYACSGIP